MRVVSGQAKGRRLKSPRTAGTRPILDRVKTALFDILSTRVEDARFLDLFAGTGGVGIEALSRGAASATFIELNAGVLKLVRENLQITGLAEGAETLHTDAFKFLQAHAGERRLAGNQGTRPQGVMNGGPTINRGPTPLNLTPKAARKNRLYITPDDDSSRRMDRIPYDIVYVAPPQYKGMAARALELLDSSPLVADTGLVIIQIFPKERDEVAAVALSRLALVDERRYGSTLLLFYEANKEGSSHVDTITEA
jgi:16S rRNA (guanine966-N2)-methyltransferase